MDAAAYLGIALLLALVLAGVPLAVAFVLGASVIAAFGMGVSLPGLAQFAFSAISSYPLLAAPFFILAGNLLLRSGGMVPLRDVIQTFIGHVPGGLPVAAILFGAVLGAVSGSAAACLAIFATVMLPIFAQMGYERPFAAGIAVTSAEIGLIIPPSVFLIIFGAFNRISITELFTAGVASGALIMALMVVVAVVISARRRYAGGERFGWAARWRALLSAVPLLLFPVLVLGGIYGGYFSPTESASVAVVYALLLGLLVYRKLSRASFVEALVDTAKITAVIYFLLVGADILARMLGYIQLPIMITGWVTDLDLGPTAFLVVVNVVLLVVGLFFSSLPMIVTVLPLFLPAVHALGIDPVLYGVLGVINASIGEITPPFGPQLWIAEPLCRVRMGRILAEAWPFLLAWIVSVFVLIAFPEIVLAPVQWTRG